jgi:shikimate kinase
LEAFGKIEKKVVTEIGEAVFVICFGGGGVTDDDDGVRNLNR